MSVLKAIHPDMEPLVPSPGGKGTPCSVSYRKVNNRHVMAVSVAKSIAWKLGFNVVDQQAKNYAEIGYDEKSGTLVLVNVSDPHLPSSDAIRWTGQSRQGTITFMIRAPWLDEAGVAPHPATRCDFSIQTERVQGREANYMEITLPAWAAPKRQIATVKTRLLDGVAHVRPGAIGR